VAIDFYLFFCQAEQLDILMGFSSKNNLEELHTE
jgi:hypothetical protein